MQEIKPQKPRFLFKKSSQNKNIFKFLQILDKLSLSSVKKYEFSVKISILNIMKIYFMM